jgi:hypothetical protein
MRTKRHNSVGDEEPEEQSDDYVVDLGGGYVHYYRGLDENTRGREYLAKELISCEVPSDEELRKADKIIEAGLDIVNVVRAAVCC